MHALGQRLPAPVVGGLHYLSAETPYRIELGGRGRLDHEYFAGDSSFARCERHSLSGIAGADRPNAAPPLVFLPQFRQKPNRVIRSPNLEGTDGLQALQFQINVGRAVIIKSHQRSAYSRFIDVPPCIVDERRTNVALGRGAAGCKTGCHSRFQLGQKDIDSR